MFITKQAVHQHLQRYLEQLDETENLLWRIHDIRNDHPTMGLRDLYFMIKPSSIGRDSFEAMCISNGLKLKPRQFKPLTTQSSGVKRFPNLIEGLVIKRANQVWQSDITYFALNGRFYYLTFIIDAFTRRIVGYAVSTSLQTIATTLVALRMAIKNRKHHSLAGLIFHSDGGGQYYAIEFLQLTGEKEILNSMCVYPYENGKAERINGVIKNNYLAPRQITTEKQLNQQVDRAVYLYNWEKPHKELKKLSPIQFEQKLGILSKANTAEDDKVIAGNHRLKGHRAPFNRSKHSLRIKMY